MGFIFIRFWLRTGRVGPGFPSGEEKMEFWTEEGKKKEKREGAKKKKRVFLSPQNLLFF